MVVSRSHAPAWERIGHYIYLFQRLNIKFPVLEGGHFCPPITGKLNPFSQIRGIWATKLAGNVAWFEHRPDSSALTIDLGAKL